MKKQTVLHLAQLDFLHARENVVLLGPPGTGKTHLASRSGVRACLAGQRVLFATATEWVARLGEAQRQAALAERAAAPAQRIPLLVVDEVGYIPFDPAAAGHAAVPPTSHRAARGLLRAERPCAQRRRRLRRWRRHDLSILVADSQDEMPQGINTILPRVWRSSSSAKASRTRSSG